jgi:hypothetical protein
VIFGNGRAPFRLADLLELVRLIDVLRDTGHPEVSSEDTAGVSAEGGGRV